MAYTLVQNKNSGGTVSTTIFTIAYNSNNTAGNILIIYLRIPFGSGKTFSVTDSAGNTWQNWGHDTVNGGNNVNTLWWVSSCAAGANTISVQQVGGGTNFFQAVIAEFNGPTPVTMKGGAAASDMAWATPNKLITQASELIVGWGIGSSGVGTTLSSAFTLRQSNINLPSGNVAGVLGDINSSAMNLYSVYGGAGTTNADYMATIATFKAASSTPPAYIQGAATSYSATASLAYPSNNTVGNLLIVAVSNAAVGGNISDTQTNTWTQIVSDTVLDGLPQVMWYAANCKGGANTVTISGGGTQSIIVTEYSGIATSNPLDQSGFNSGVSTHFTSGVGVSTTSTNVLALGLASNSTGNNSATAPVADSPWGAVDNAGNIVLVSFQSVGAGSYAYSGTFPNNNNNFGGVALIITAEPGSMSGFVQGHRDFINKRGVDS